MKLSWGWGGVVNCWKELFLFSRTTVLHMKSYIPKDTFHLLLKFRKISFWLGKKKKQDCPSHSKTAEKKYIYIYIPFVLFCLEIPCSLMEFNKIILSFPPFFNNLCFQLQVNPTCELFRDWKSTNITKKKQKVLGRRVRKGRCCLTTDEEVDFQDM